MTIIQRSAQEIKDILLDGRVEKLYQLDTYTFLFAIYSRKKLYHLVVSLIKRSGRFHLVFERVHRSHFISSETTLLLNKYIARCRIIHILLSNKSIELGLAHNETYRLIIDFFDSGVRLVNENGESLLKSGIRSSGEEELLQGGRLLLRDHVSRGTAFPINEALSKEFMTARADILKQSVLKIVKREEKKVTKLIEKLNAEQQEVERRDWYRKMGELIKYNLPHLFKGSEKFTVVDFSGKEVNIPVDPLLSPLENMNAYFKTYKKLKKKETALEERVTLIEERLQSLKGLQEELSGRDCFHLSGPRFSFLRLFDESKIERRLLERVRDAYLSAFLSTFDAGTARRRRGREQVKYLRFVSAAGKQILVGRSAQENEELTLRAARGNDLWFHAEFGTGSHVVLRCEKKHAFTESDILDAAHLALYFSKHRRQKQGDVVFTHCKYINKPKNSKTGYVTYHNNKTRHFVLDETVLKRLLTQRPLPQD